MADYVDDVLEELEEEEVSGTEDEDGPDEDDEEMIDGLVEVGALTEVGARKARRTMRRSVRRAVLLGAMKKWKRKQGRIGRGEPSPPFARSTRSTERRAPLGFVEDTTGANFFSLAATVGATTQMRAKVSRTAHANRFLIVPSAPGVVLESIKVGDEEQLLSAGAPVELYSVDALTDSVPDNFSPLGRALDFVVTLKNTTAGAITGTIGIKASVKR